MTPDDQRRLRELLDELDAWARGSYPSGLGASWHAEKFAQLTPSARRQLTEYVQLLRAATEPLLALAERHHAVIAELRELAEHYGESHPAVADAYRTAAALLTEGVDE
jgi:fructose-1-phosphate kinase PfkB-like protein